MCKDAGGIPPDVAERIAADINHLLFSVWKMKVCSTIHYTVYSTSIYHYTEVPYQEKRTGLFIAELTVISAVAGLIN